MEKGITNFENFSVRQEDGCALGSFLSVMIVRNVTTRNGFSQKTEAPDDLLRIRRVVQFLLSGEVNDPRP